MPQSLGQECASPHIMPGSDLHAAPCTTLRALVHVACPRRFLLLDFCFLAPTCSMVLCVLAQNCAARPTRIQFPRLPSAGSLTRSSPHSPRRFLNSRLLSPTCRHLSSRRPAVLLQTPTVQTCFDISTRMGSAHVRRPRPRGTAVLAPPASGLGTAGRNGQSAPGLRQAAPVRRGVAQR